MESGFNLDTVTSSFPEGLPIKNGESTRFRYYLMRRNGVLHFVKTPTEKYLHDLVTTQALKKEFLIGYGLNHPGIVRYYAFDDYKLYEEYIEGATLREMIDKEDTRLKDKNLLRSICIQILEALSYLHSKGVIHLDLKPENVMITTIGNQVKIIDLSCAKSASNDTVSGYTEGYEAPEQLTGNANITTDIYQLGKIMEELCEYSGVVRPWRKFIEKSTANHPDNRFKNSEEALKRVPQNHRISTKWFTHLLLLMILGGIISLIVTRPQKDNLIETKNQEVVTPPPIQQDPSIEEVKVEETVKPREPKFPIQSSKEEIEDKLNKLLYQKIDELYSVKVIPMYNRMMADSVYRYQSEVSNEFVNAYMSALKQLELYGEELKKQYPGQEDFIDERIRRIYETKNGKMRDKLYPQLSN